MEINETGEIKIKLKNSQEKVIQRVKGVVFSIQNNLKKYALKID